MSIQSKKVCVIGAGRWGKNHIRTLDQFHALAGIVDSNREVLAAHQNQYPHIKIFKQIQDAVKEDFDGFIISTPAETHYQIAECVLHAGKHVLVEKPMTLNLADAVRLRDLAAEQGVNLMVGHVLLFHPAIQKIKELIRSDKIGKLQYIYSNRLNLGTVRKEENILWSFAPHDIAIFQYLVESLPVEIVSRGGAFLQTHIHDSTMTILTYPNNIVVHNFVSWLHPFKEHRLVIIGSKGMLSFEDSSEEKEVLYYEKGIDWVSGEPIKREGPTEVIPYDQAMPLTEELKYFLNHLDGSPVQIANAQNAVEVLTILEKATESLLHEHGTEHSKTSAGSSNREGKVFVHPTSFVDQDVKIGEGTKIWHFSHIQSESEIGKHCSLGQNVNVGNRVKIGNHVKIQNNVSVYEGIELEDYVFCGPSMVFTNILDPRSKYPQRGNRFYKKTLVREGASIGANATIVCGNTVGKHAFIGAGAVVTHDVPDYALMVGVPAKQKGWVCECGEKLNVAKEKAVCVRCQRKYGVKNKLLVPV